MMPQRVVTGMGILDRISEPGAERVLERMELRIRAYDEARSVDRLSRNRRSSGNGGCDRLRPHRGKRIGKAAHESRRRDRRASRARRAATETHGRSHADRRCDSRASQPNSSFHAEAAAGLTEYIRAFATYGIGIPQAKRRRCPNPRRWDFSSIAWPSAMSDSDRPRCQNRLVSSSLCRPGFRPATICPSSA